MNDKRYKHFQDALHSGNGILMIVRSLSSDAWIQMSRLIDRMCCYFMKINVHFNSNLFSANTGIES